MSFESYLQDVIKEIDKINTKNRKKAAAHVKKALRKKVAERFGISGNLYKGVDRYNGKESSFVGFMSPAQHAHLIEFGTDERFIKNYHGKQGVVVSSGRMPKRPLLQPVFDEEAEAVKRIMSGL